MAAGGLKNVLCAIDQASVDTLDGPPYRPCYSDTHGEKKGVVLTGLSRLITSTIGCQNDRYLSHLNYTKEYSSVGWAACRWLWSVHILVLSLPGGCDGQHFPPAAITVLHTNVPRVVRVLGAMRVDGALRAVDLDSFRGCQVVSWGPPCQGHGQLHSTEYFTFTCGARKLAPPTKYFPIKGLSDNLRSEYFVSLTTV